MRTGRGRHGTRGRESQRRSFCNLAIELLPRLGELKRGPESPTQAHTGPIGQGGSDHVMDTRRLVPNPTPFRERKK